MVTIDNPSNTLYQLPPLTFPIIQKLNGHTTNMNMRYSLMVLPYRYFPNKNVGTINPIVYNRKSMDLLFLMGNG